MTNPNASLKRALGLAHLTFYGLGGILGAGVYALIGKVAGASGTACWLAFLVSFVVASFTGLTYCELGSRFPKSAGESVYSLAAFRKQSFSYLIGFFVCLSGVVSTGEHIDAGLQQLLGDLRRGPAPRGSVLGVGNDVVGGDLIAQGGKERRDRAPACLAHDVAQQEDAHGLG